jgi:hypothetical protein
MNLFPMNVFNMNLFARIACAPGTLCAVAEGAVHIWYPHRVHSDALMCRSTAASGVQEKTK